MFLCGVASCMALFVLFASALMVSHGLFEVFRPHIWWLSCCVCPACFQAVYRIGTSLVFLETGDRFSSCLRGLALQVPTHFTARCPRSVTFSFVFLAFPPRSHESLDHVGSPFYLSSTVRHSSATGIDTPSPYIATVCMGCLLSACV